MICLRHLIWPRAVTNWIIFIPKKPIFLYACALSYHLIYLPFFFFFFFLMNNVFYRTTAKVFFVPLLYFVNRIMKWIHIVTVYYREFSVSVEKVKSPPFSSECIKAFEKPLLTLPARMPEKWWFCITSCLSTCRRCWWSPLWPSRESKGISEWLDTLKGPPTKR